MNFIAIVGGIFALIGTFWGLNIKSLKKEEKREDYKNDILSMIDLTAYKASKISKIHLSETNALINKPQTLEKCDDVEGLL